MRTQKSAVSIFGSILILGLIAIPSCLASANKEQQLAPQTAPNAAVLDSDTQSDFINTLSVNEQRPPICSMPNLSIPDLGTQSHTISIADNFVLSDLDVYLNILHPYVGDIKVTINHNSMLDPVVLIDKLRCGGSNIDVTINDEGIDGNVANQCEDAPAIHGDRVGGNPPLPALSAFDGNDISGDWVLTVSDSGRGDAGTLVEWCLIPTPSCYALTINHTGEGSDPVASPLNSINCPVGEYAPGENISLSGAIPNPGWQIGSWTNTDNDVSTTSSNTVTMSSNALIASVNYTKESAACETGTFIFTGIDASTGAVNKKAFSINNLNVNVSGWSSDNAMRAFTPAYIGAYTRGLGVTDFVGDGDGSNDQHTLENSGSYNYLLFEFDRSVIPDQIYLGYTANDSDLSVWFGYVPSGVNPHTNHQTLNSDLLGTLFAETNAGNNSIRWADINSNNEHGNVLVVAAQTGENDDHILLERLTICLDN